MSADCETPLVLRVLRARWCLVCELSRSIAEGYAVPIIWRSLGKTAATASPFSVSKRPSFQLVEWVIHALKRCTITTTEYPGTSAPCAMIHGVDDPELLCCDGTKCHMASTAIA